MAYLLSALAPGGADLQKLVLLDYAIVYSGDLGGPSSLHTPVPYRGAELFIHGHRQVLCLAVEVAGTWSSRDSRKRKNSSGDCQRSSTY
ncbi:ABC-three component system middle component 2 [Thiobacillus sp.]